MYTLYLKEVFQIVFNLSLPCPIDAAVLRVPVLYGDVEKLEESAVTILFDKVQFSHKSANMDHWQQRFPTYVKDVATVCFQLTEKKMQVRTDTKPIVSFTNAFRGSFYKAV